MRSLPVGLVALILCAGLAFAEEPTKPKPDRTVFGVVHGGSAYAASGRTALVIGDLQENPPVSRRLELQGDSEEIVFPPRWRVSPTGTAMMLGAPLVLLSERERWYGVFFEAFIPV